MVNQRTLRQTARIPFFPEDANRTSGGGNSHIDPMIKNGFIDIRTNPQTKDAVSYVVKRPGTEWACNPNGSGYGTDDYYTTGFWVFGSYAYLTVGDRLLQIAIADFNGGTAVTPSVLYRFETLEINSAWTYSATLQNSFGDDFFNDYRYNGTLYIDQEHGECLYITNGIEDVIVDKAGTLHNTLLSFNRYVSNTYYKPGDKVIPSTANGYYYMLLGEAGVTVLESIEPTWPTTPGDKVVSAAGNTWVCMYRNGIQKVAKPYINTTYSVGDLVQPSTESGYYYICTKAGTATGEPTWTQIQGDTSDAGGGTEFTCVGSYGGKPGLALPMPVYLDTYVVLNAYKTSDLYNCDPTTPNSWNALNFISADSFTSYTRAIARYNNYIIAYGETDSELFYNNANTTGSPFSRHESFLLQVGCESQSGVIVAESIIAWIGRSAMGGHAIWMLDGFEPKEISTNWVNKLLEAEEAPDRYSGSYAIRIAGHNLLVWPLKTAAVALVFDIGLNLWYYWTLGDGGQGQDSDPNGWGSTKNPNVTAIRWPYTRSAYYNNTLYLTSGNTPYVFNMSEDIYIDRYNSSVGYYNRILFEIRTPKIDFGNRMRKFFHSMDVIGDIATSTTYENYLYVTWSDEPDDYAAFTTYTASAIITLDLSGRPRITGMGSSRRRAYRFYSNKEIPIRLEAFDLNYTQGIS